MKIPSSLPFLNESHTVSLSGLVSASSVFNFQFFTRFAAVFSEEVGDFFSLRSELVIISSIPPPVEITLGSKLHQSVAHW